VLAGAKHCWLAWLKSFSGGPDAGNLPAVIVREILDSEVSVELYRKGSGLKARAVFGLPEGLYDPAVSADILEFGQDGRLGRMEAKPQTQQFISGRQGPARVPVAPDFRSEAKVSAEMLPRLSQALDFMRQNPGITSVTVCFVSSRPVVYSAALSAARAAPAEIPPRDRSISLMEPPAKPGRSEPAPVLAMRLYLTVSGPEDIAGLGETYADGVLVEGGAISRQEWSGAFSSFAAEARRKLNAQEMVFEIKDLAQGTLKALAEACNAARFAGAKPAVLIPGIRSPEELAKTTRTIGAALPDALRPSIWARVMYPSNLYFMDSMAADAVALDADSLGRLMLGIEGGSWADMSTQALERAIQPMLDSRKCPVAVLARDMVSMPTFLEFLVRNRADIICIRPEELKTVRHIVASVEKRMVLERGA